MLVALELAAGVLGSAVMLMEESYTGEDRELLKKLLNERSVGGTISTQERDVPISTTSSNKGFS